MPNTNQRPKRATIIDVAKLAGVSPSTASRVFDEKWKDKIRPQTKEAVIKAAAELGYLGANVLGRSMRGQRSNMIALVMGGSVGYFYAEMVMKFVRALRATGRQVLIFEGDADKDLAELVAQVHCYQVDAAIITSGATPDVVVDSFGKADVPLLLFNRRAHNKGCSAVWCDGTEGAALAADYLYEKGHRTFAVISGDRNASKELGRTHGFGNRIQALGGQMLAVIDADYRYEAGFAATCELLEQHRPDAIFCCEDTIAMGAIDAARQKFGLRIPEDISIMGFDNTTLARFAAYNLTTVGFPIADMLESTTEVLEQIIADPTAEIHKSFPMQIVERGSVRSLNGQALENQ